MNPALYLVMLKSWKLFQLVLLGKDVILRWQGEDHHVGRIPCDFLRDHNYSADGLSTRNQQTKINTYMVIFYSCTIADVL